MLHSLSVSFPRADSVLQVGFHSLLIIYPAFLHRSPASSEITSEACVLSLTRRLQQLIISLKYSRQPLKSAQLLHWVLGLSTFSHAQDLCTGKRSKDRHDRWILRTLCDFPGCLCRTAFLFWLVVYRKAPKRKPDSKVLDFGRWCHTYECFSWNLWESFVFNETKYQTSKTDPEEMRLILWIRCFS